MNFKHRTAMLNTVSAYEDGNQIHISAPESPFQAPRLPEKCFGFHKSHCKAADVCLRSWRVTALHDVQQHHTITHLIHKLDS